MQKTLAFALCAAVGAAASAHPFGEQWSSGRAPGPIGGVDSQQLVDEDFEAYSVGQAMTTRGSWELWGGLAVDAFITDARASSGTKSADFSPHEADVVHQFSGLTSGQVSWSTMTYIPSGSAVWYYMIALDRYDGGGAGTSWSLQIQFDAAFGELVTDFSGERTPMIFDRWVEFRVELDLDADAYDVFYDGVQFVFDKCWTCTVQGSPPGTGAREFAAIDLFTRVGGAVFLDDVRIEAGAGCYADCDLSGTLDFFDFLCFQNAFAVGDPYADCDRSGTHDFFDFLCFQNEFARGCP